MDLLLICLSSLLLTLIANLNTSVYCLSSHFRPDKIDIIQTNGPFKDEGTWHGPFYCPKNEYVVAFTLNWQLYRGSHASWCAQQLQDGTCRESSVGRVLTRDDNGVTGMMLRCGSFNQTGGTLNGKLPASIWRMKNTDLLKS